MNYSNWPISKKKNSPNFGGPQYKILYSNGKWSTKNKKPDTLKAPPPNIKMFILVWSESESKKNILKAKAFTPPSLKENKEVLFNVKTRNEYTIYELGVSLIKKPTLLGLP